MKLLREHSQLKPWNEKTQVHDLVFCEQPKAWELMFIFTNNAKQERHRFNFESELKGKMALAAATTDEERKATRDWLHDEKPDDSQLFL